MADISLKIKSDFAQAEADLKSMGTLSESMQKKLAKLQTQLADNSIGKFTERNKLAAAAVTATSGRVAGMQKEYYGLRSEIQRLIKSGLDPQNKELQKLIKDYDVLGKELTSTTTKTKSATSGFMKLAAAAGGLYAIKRGITFIVDEARKLEDAQAAFTPLMGGAEKAKELVNALNIVAAETPFRFDDISKAAKQLLPVMNGDIKKVTETFKMLGDTAGGNAQKLESITRGYTKAMLKGKVDMESLNMIAEAGVPIHTELAKSMGYGEKQMGSFFKAVSQGKVSTNELEKAFKTMTKEGGLFYQGMIIASKTTSGVFSTLSDNISLTAAAIGTAFLPYIKQVAIWLIEVTSGIRKWISEGDNLSKTLTTIGYVLAGLATGLAIYSVAFGGLGTAIMGVIPAMKAFTAVLAANPIGAIAVLITAVLIPALIYMYNNWDKVKFKVKDFSLSAQIKLLEVAEVINVKILQAMANLYKSFAGIPGMGKLFGPMIVQQSIYTAKIHNSTKALKLQQQGARQEFAASQERSKKEIETQKKKAEAVKNKNKIINESNKGRKQSFVQMLEEMTAAEVGKRAVDEKAAKDFYLKRAEMESEDFNKRLEFLNAQSAIIQANSKLNAEQRISAEKGVQKAISAIEKQQLNSRLQYGKNLVSTVGSMLSDIQQIFINAGKESRALAIVLKALAMAEAGINTALAFTKALASAPPPFNFIMAGAVAAAGLAQQVKIATTPIPSAQTGLSNYTVPDTRSNQRDGAAFMASAGEKVTVTPRGEQNNKDMIVNVQIEDSVLIRVIQKYIDTGRIDVNNKNIGRGVFAT